MSDENKVDAWMPLWIGSYLADTTALSRDEHGGYLLLLMAYWRNKGPLLERGNSLGNIVKATPAEWRTKLRPVLVEFFSVQDGLWLHGRAEDELKKALANKTAAVSKAIAGANARWGKGSKDATGDAPADASGDAPSIATGDANALPKQCPTPSPSSLRSVSKASPSHPATAGTTFDRFWRIYPRKEGKEAARKAFAKLDVDEALLTRMLNAITLQKASDQWKRDGGQYIPHPTTWLNGRRWQDGENGDGALGLPWHETQAGIVAKGVELGLGEWSEALWCDRKAPDFITYRTRVYEAAGLEAVPA